MNLFVIALMTSRHGSISALFLSCLTLLSDYIFYAQKLVWRKIARSLNCKKITQVPKEIFYRHLRNCNSE